MDEEGLLEGNDEVVVVFILLGYINFFGEINKVWGEVFMNVNMEFLLVGYEDFCMEKYFDKVIGFDVISFIDYKGIYKGIC